MKTTLCAMKPFSLCILVYLFSIFSHSSFAQEAKAPVTTKHRELIENSRNILFLGDSITYGGHYVANFETWLAITYPFRYIYTENLGLPSETVSGLSEKGHAGGKFPRPDLHERLDRVLAETKPDLIFACYGMNCGIYLPLDAQRLQKYKDGINKLRKKAKAAGSKIIFITPPHYDSLRNNKHAYYTKVLVRYSSWLVSMRNYGWNVIDLNSHMANAIAEKRKSNPNFTYQRDAIHPDIHGHWVMTQPILAWFGDQKSAACKSIVEMVKVNQHNPDIIPLIKKRSLILRNAYLTKTGHKRPGIPKGLPFIKAIQQAGELESKMKQLTKASELTKRKNR